MANGDDGGFKMLAVAGAALGGAYLLFGGGGGGGFGGSGSFGVPSPGGGFARDGTRTAGTQGSTATDSTGPETDAERQGAASSKEASAAGTKAVETSSGANIPYVPGSGPEGASGGGEYLGTTPGDLSLPVAQDNYGRTVTSVGVGSTGGNATTGDTGVR